MPIVVAKQLVKDYVAGDILVNAIRGVDFSIEPASLVSFIGPSGSGKSTLLNMVGCLDRPTSGMLQVAGQEIANLDRKEAARFRGDHIGFVFQDFNLIPVLTVFENVAYPLQMVKSCPRQEQKTKVQEILHATGMEDQAHKYPNQLSGGQKQRVAIARALVTNAKLVLADEPTANLDKDTATRIINLMKKMRSEYNTTFIFSTHDPRIVENVDITFTLEDGELKTNRTSQGESRA